MAAAEACGFVAGTGLSGGVADAARDRAAEAASEVGAVAVARERLASTDCAAAAGAARNRPASPGVSASTALSPRPGVVSGFWREGGTPSPGMLGPIPGGRIGGPL